MSKMRLTQVFLIIIALEFIAATALVIWAVTTKRHPAAPVPAAVTPTAPAPTPALKPVLFASGLARPTAIAATAESTDQRLFVAEQRGTIQVIHSHGKPDAQPLLDIQSKVLDDSQEMGLLGVVLDPNFKQNSSFYVNYIDKAQESVLARYTVSAKTGVADPSSEKVLLKFKQPYPNHKGGSLAFGPDGYLYAGFGDGGSGGDPQNRAQDLSVPFGKILRLDVNHGTPYAVPAGNPFVKTAGAMPEVWAYGLRNPWRISFDSQTGDLYIADVGQGALEEIDVQKAGDKGGENYGWRCYEGTHSYNTAGCKAANDYVTPALQYDHSDKRCAVAGGYVYRGSRFPAMQGKYFYGDYCGGQIYYATKEQEGKWHDSLGVSTNFAISTFGQGSDGELYVADLNSGDIYHLVDSVH